MTPNYAATVSNYSGQLLSLSTFENFLRTRYPFYDPQKFAVITTRIIY